MSWPHIKNGTDSGAMPVKVSVNILDIVTAGLAKDVDEVNQYPAAINKATPVATELLSCFLINKIVSISPDVAIISLASSGQLPLMFCDI